MKIESSNMTNVVEIDLGENDILVVEVSATISQAQAEHLRSYVLAKLKQKGQEVFVIDSGCTIKVLHRPALDVNEA